MNSHSLLRTTVAHFAQSWKVLALTDVAYKIIAFIVLTPLVGVLFRTLISLSGRSVLADQDILFFFLGPIGWLCFVVVGGLWLGVAALEQAALMGILAAAATAKRLTVLDALKFAVAHGRPVVKLAARLLAIVLLAVAPFLLAAGLTYSLLLGEHDINFYLKEKPPEFLIAIGIGGIIVAGLLAVLLRLITGWFFALPIVLFEGRGASDSLRVSAGRTVGQRKLLVKWVVGWAVASMVVSSVTSSIVIFVGQLTVPHATESLSLMVVVLGIMLLLWTISNLAVNLLSTTAFAAILFNLYQHVGTEGELDVSRLNLTDEEAASVRGFTRGRVISTAVIGFLVAAIIGVAAIESVRLEDHTEITAHRGASAAAPENTMAAVKQAIADGTDWIEIDVQETADDEVVVFHDSDFMKVAGNSLKIWDATMADLKNIDIGSWFAPQFRNERVPTLAEVLDTCKGQARVNIELKYYGHDKQLEQRVIDIVEAHNMADEVVLMSLKLDAVEKVKALRPGWTVGLLLSVSAGDLNKINADFLAINAGFANRRFVQSAHDRGQQVYVWTVNDAPTMSTMIGRGVDSLITDKPALARSVLKQRADLSAPQRLLLELAGIFGVMPEIAEQ